MLDVLTTMFFAAWDKFTNKPGEVGRADIYMAARCGLDPRDKPYQNKVWMDETYDWTPVSYEELVAQMKAKEEG